MDSHHDSDLEDIPSNPNVATTIGDLIEQRLSRRALLLGALAATTQLRGSPLVAQQARREPGSSLTFTGIDNTLGDTHRVARGYSARVLIRWGDPVLADAPDFDADALTAAAQREQFGYNNDFIGYLPLPRGSASSDHGLLCVNHEFGNPELMFRGATHGEPLTAEQTAVDMAATGHSVLEVQRGERGWQVVANSRHARRLHAETPMRVSGPAAGQDRLKTPADPTGRAVLGTMNNCAGGITPWGTVLIAEENFNKYFTGDFAELPEAAKLARYGFGKVEFPWGDHVERFHLPSHPNEPNRFGWVVEFDPYDPASVPVKRTALGRFKHEGATTIVNHDGRLVVFMGDDERFEYVYRFVSEGRVDREDRAANRDLLDRGTLSVARFHADGALHWLPLVHGEGPLTPENGFASQADVVIDCRLAADLLGATPMDRPEDVEPHPANGAVYVMLTNNTARTPDRVDGANPRGPNPFGHVVEMRAPRRDGGDFDHAAEAYRWEVLLRAGDPRRKGHGASYHADVADTGWLACPDNAAVDPAGRLWITTDGGNPHGIADGVWACDVAGEGRALTKKFFACPRGAEMCGPCFTPDGKTLFVAVQHPGEESGSTFDRPSTRWPDFADGVPPRPALVVITRDDGGEIGG